MARGKRIPWDQVAAMARQADGAWRVHPSLAVANEHTLRHARRRVPQMDPQPDGTFEFARGDVAKDELGRPIFSLFVRFVRKEDHDQDT
jgi:hypothetical protein